MNYRNVFFLAIIFFLILIFGDSLACSCANESTLEESFESADVVFLGTASDVQSNVVEGRVYNGVTYPGMFGETKTVFSVKKIWKGSFTPFLSAGGAFGGTGSCSTGFEKGKDYLIFAKYTKNPGEIYTSICSGNHVVENELDSDIIALGAPLIDLNLFLPVVLLIIILAVFFVYKKKFLKK